MNAKSVAWISAGCAVAALLFGSGTYYGWKSKVEQEAVRARVIDDDVKKTEPILLRLNAVENKALVNSLGVEKLAEGQSELQARVGELVETQRQTNDELHKLSSALLEYLAAQPRQPTKPR